MSNGTYERIKIFCDTLPLITQQISLLCFFYICSFDICYETQLTINYNQLQVPQPTPESQKRRQRIVRQHKSMLASHFRGALRGLGPIEPSQRGLV